ncbi:MAG: hypothetical protein B6I26_05050 [Desulfobacteraceae bacterium 4572_130]|nr:MAG: hypothetical protein B6I26_05050 [Desulfobacteraceae bacterium 4572_130]
MKKIFIVAFIAIVGIAFTAPAFAIEHEFGGYWRTRMYTQKNFDGSDSSTPDVITDYTRTDTRSRIYYTAILNDNLKFVNKFEMNATWGVAGGSHTANYGDIGADGLSVLVKNSYVDFNVGSFNAKLGTQPAVVHRGLVFDDDFSGLMLSIDSSIGTTSGGFLKIDESSDNTGSDVNGYLFKHQVNLDSITLAPTFVYTDAADGDYTYFLGADVDGNFGPTTLWGTLVYQGGVAGNTSDGLGVEQDISAWLIALGGNHNINDSVGIHGKFLFSTGNDINSDDVEGFGTDFGGYYYVWAEIMGGGIFDGQSSAYTSGAFGLKNVIAFNVGTTYQACEKLSLDFDLWYAKMEEVTHANQDDSLGLEIDVKATYQIIDGLSLELVGAYLFAGDGTQFDSDTSAVYTNDENPFEIGTRLSLSF